MNDHDADPALADLERKMDYCQCHGAPSRFPFHALQVIMGASCLLHITEGELWREDGYGSLRHYLRVRWGWLDPADPLVVAAMGMQS